MCVAHSLSGWVAAEVQCRGMRASFPSAFRIRCSCCLFQASVSLGGPVPHLDPDMQSVTWHPFRSRFPLVSPSALSECSSPLPLAEAIHLTELFWANVADALGIG